LSENGNIRGKVIKHGGSVGGIIGAIRIIVVIVVIIDTEDIWSCLIDYIQVKKSLG